MKIDEQTLERMRPMILAGQATDAQLEAKGFDVATVAAIKADREAFNLRCYAPPEEFEIKQLSERRFLMPMTNERPDHAGDILKAGSSAWNMTVFNKNKIALWAHRTLDPIGTWPVVSKAEVNGLPGLVGEIELAPKGASSVADTVAALLESKVLRAISVGFKFLETKEVNSPEERQKLGLGPFGVLGTKMMLFEGSVVSVPMNPDAVGKAFDELRTTGAVTKAGVEDTLPGFMLTERDYGNILKDCAGKFHALGAISKAEESIDTATSVIEAFKALEESTKGAEPAEPEPAAAHNYTTSGTGNGNDLIVHDVTVTTVEAGEDSKAIAATLASIDRRLAQLEEAAPLADLAIRQADIIATLADEVSEHLRAAEDRSPTEALDDTEAFQRRVVEAINHRTNKNTSTLN